MPADGAEGTFVSASVHQHGRKQTPVCLAGRPLMGLSVCLGNVPSFAWVLWRGMASSRRVRPPVLVASARLLCARAPSGLQAIKSCSHVWRAPLMRTARRGGCRRRASSAPGRSPPGVRFRGSAVVCPWGFPHRWHLCAATPVMEFDHVRARSATVVVLGSMKRTMRVLRRLVCVVSPPLLDPAWRVAVSRSTCCPSSLVGRWCSSAPWTSASGPARCPLLVLATVSSPRGTGGDLFQPCVRAVKVGLWAGAPDAAWPVAARQERRALWTGAGDVMWLTESVPLAGRAPRRWFFGPIHQRRCAPGVAYVDARAARGVVCQAGVRTSAPGLVASGRERPVCAKDGDAAHTWL